MFVGSSYPLIRGGVDLQINDISDTHNVVNMGVAIDRQYDLVVSGTEYALYGFRVVDGPWAGKRLVTEHDNGTVQTLKFTTQPFDLFRTDM